MENGHWNSGFSHWKQWFSIAMLVITRGSIQQCIQHSPDLATNQACHPCRPYFSRTSASLSLRNSWRSPRSHWLKIPLEFLGQKNRKKKCYVGNWNWKLQLKQLKLLKFTKLNIETEQLPIDSCENRIRDLKISSSKFKWSNSTMDCLNKLVFMVGLQYMYHISKYEITFYVLLCYIALFYLMLYYHCVISNHNGVCEIILCFITYFI